MYKKLGLRTKITPLAFILFAFTAFGVFSTTSIAKDTVEIEFLTNQYVPEASKVFKESIALYEKMNPNVKIKFKEVPFPSLFETIDTTLASGAPVMDVFSADAPLVPKYAAAGAILPFKNYTDEEMKDFLPGELEEAMWNGKFYAAPQITSSQGIYINKALFKKAGVPLPSTNPANRLTWAEVRNIAKKLTKTNGDITTQWGLIVEQSTAPYQLYPLIQSLGGEVISPDGSTVDGYINSPKAIKAMTFYQDLYCFDQVSPKEYVPEAFTSGKTAMMLGGTWHVGNFASKTGLDWMVTPHPYFEKEVTPTGSFHVAVNANTNHPKEATDFAKYLTGTQRSIALAKATNEIPSRKSVFEALPRQFAAHPNDIFLYELKNTAIPRARTPAYGAMEDILRGTFQSIITCADVKSTLNSAVARIDSFLKE